MSSIQERCNAIEECYEFMLAYAAQGLAGNEANRSNEQLRDFMGRAVQAISGLAESYTAAIQRENLSPAERHQAFLTVLNRDARDSLAAMELVLGQPGISSQLIDNLNASIHLRALLTDLFLIDEILKLHSRNQVEAGLHLDE